jgi:hypothetical protein
MTELRVKLSRLIDQCELVHTTIVNPSASNLNREVLRIKQMERMNGIIADLNELRESTYDRRK